MRKESKYFRGSRDRRVNRASCQLVVYSEPIKCPRQEGGWLRSIARGAWGVVQGGTFRPGVANRPGERRNGSLHLQKTNQSIGERSNFNHMLAANGDLVQLNRQRLNQLWHNHTARWAQGWDVAVCPPPLHSPLSKPYNGFRGLHDGGLGLYCKLVSGGFRASTRPQYTLMDSLICDRCSLPLPSLLFVSLFSQSFLPNSPFSQLFRQVSRRFYHANLKESHVGLGLWC